jgi:hypothetical protein
MAAFDPLRGRAVLFGGATQNMGSISDQLDDTWEWDGADWVKIPTTYQPFPRVNGAMVYDEARQVMVLFGGQYKNIRLNDTWIYQERAWKNIPSGDSPLPPGRTGHKLFFDPARQKVILSGGYGGRDSNGEELFYQDAWEWDGEAWKQIESQTPNPYLISYSIAKDPVLGRIVVMNHDNILSWSGDHWTELSTSHPPTARMDASLGELPGMGILVFGGSHNNANLDDTWLLRGAAWERVISPLRPSPRATMMAFSDLSRRRVYLYGGNGGFNPYLDDMWVYTLP